MGKIQKLAVTAILVSKKCFIFSRWFCPNPDSTYMQIERSHPVYPDPRYTGSPPGGRDAAVRRAPDQALKVRHPFGFQS